jgi:hypothetical protein
MCRQDLINQERIYTSFYSSELIELIAKGDDIKKKNIEIINKNRKLLREKNIIESQILEDKEIERKLLKVIFKGDEQVKKEREQLKNIKRKIRIERIKQVNLKKQKLRKYGKLFI